MPRMISARSIAPAGPAIFGLAPLALLALSALFAGCASLPENVGRQESRALADTADTRLGQALAPQLAMHPGESGCLPLGNGLDAFVARAAMADEADRSLDVQYYLYHDDLTGCLLTEQLVRAAERGVRVRVLVDDMDLDGRDLQIASIDGHPNIQVRLFNPFGRGGMRATEFVTRFGDVTRRMHNKSFTIDNQATIVGGRNIGDEYFDADPELAFADLDVLAVGPVVADVSEAFDLYWNHELAYPIATLRGQPPSLEEFAAARPALSEFVAAQADSPYIQALRDSELARRIRDHGVELEWGMARALFDHPDKIAAPREESELRLATALSPYLANVRDELIIFSAYFVPSTQGVESLVGLVERGVRVRILTNSYTSTDVSIVHAGYSKFRLDLLRGGVELYELNRRITDAEIADNSSEHGASKASLHAKSFVIDRERVFIGSFNLDPRSVYENTEIGLMLDCPGIAAGMAEWLDAELARIAFRVELGKSEFGAEQMYWHGQIDGEQVVFDAEPYTDLIDRIGLRFMRLLPADDQL